MDHNVERADLLWRVGLPCEMAHSRLQVLQVLTLLRRWRIERRLEDGQPGYSGHRYEEHRQKRPDLFKREGPRNQKDRCGNQDGHDQRDGAHEGEIFTFHYGIILPMDKNTERGTEYLEFARAVWSDIRAKLHQLSINNTVVEGCSLCNLPPSQANAVAETIIAQYIYDLATTLAEEMA